MEKDVCGELRAVSEKLCAPKYDVRGPEGDYTCTVSVLGSSETGAGRSKKVARRSAAKKLLEFLKKNVVDQSGAARDGLVLMPCNNPVTVERTVTRSTDGGGADAGTSKCKSLPKNEERTLQGVYESAASEAPSASGSLGYPLIEKDFYIEDVMVANCDPREVERIRSDNNMIVQGNNGHIPNPIQTFRQAFAHYPLILAALQKVGFEKPSQIQMQAWPVILKGLDLICIAQTGQGKTLAFLLPAFIHVDGQPANRDSRGGARVLVLTPTRERALRIEEEVKRFKYNDITCVCLSGDESRVDQTNGSVKMIVATPGRLIDLISAKKVDVSSVTYLVLDNADHMYFGFHPDIQMILLDIRPERQTIVTSATWPVGLQYLTTNYMSNPVKVFVASMDPTANAEHRKKEGRGRGVQRTGSSFRDDVGGFGYDQDDCKGGGKLFPFSTDSV